HQGETTAHTGKLFQTAGNDLVAHAQFRGYGDSRQGIEYIVFSGQVQAHGQQGKVAARPLALHIKTHGGTTAFNVDCTYLSLRINAIRGDRARYKRND